VPRYPLTLRRPREGKGMPLLDCRREYLMSRTTQVKLHLLAMAYEVYKHHRLHLGFHTAGIYRAIKGL